MTTYYLEFKTWIEGSVMLPGRYRWIGEISDYRNKSDLKTPVHPNKIQSVFSSLNEEAITQFLSEHVLALIIGLLTDGVDEISVVSNLEKLLGPIEVLGITEVTESNSATISKLMEDAVN